MNVLNNSTGNKELFNKNDKVAWMADDPKTGDKYLAVFNTDDQQQAVEEKAKWNSGILNRETQSKRADANITGLKNYSWW